MPSRRIFRHMFRTRLERGGWYTSIRMAAGTTPDTLQTASIDSRVEGASRPIRNAMRMGYCRADLAIGRVRIVSGQ